MVFAEILKALAMFAWPLVVFILVYMCRTQLRTLLEELPKLLHRLESAKMASVELQLASLETKTAEAQEQSEKQEELSANKPPLVPPTPIAKQLEVGDRDTIKTIKELAELASPSALRLLSVAMEKAIRLIMAPAGLLSQYASPGQAIGVLLSRKVITVALADSIQTWFNLVNRTSHSRFDEAPYILQDMVASGLPILELLQAVPRNRYEVVYAGVPLFSDPALTQPVDEGTGVIIQAYDPNGIKSAVQNVFPTTRSFVVGTDVSWEWNSGKGWGPMWFRHPQTGDITAGLTSASEFTGRNLATI